MAHVPELPAPQPDPDPSGHDAAAEQYGDEERAHRVAYSALKHTHEKVGDHWEPKDEYGPSDDQAEGGVDTPADAARAERVLQATTPDFAEASA